MLQVTKVVLFKHGVGYFERRGKVADDAALELFFKASEMNDVLKSLTVLDLSGGLISSISYDSDKPVEKRLEDIAIRLPDENALSGLLSQLKGARVAVEIGNRRVEGVLAGTETVTRKQDGLTSWDRFVTLVVDGGGLQSFELMKVKEITFLDESLRKDLQHLLDTLVSAKKKDRKRLTIFARGEGERTVAVSYIVETPVWKTSYRVLLDDESLIQGWALVDNTHDEDWEDVSLVLVAGLPVSFVHDLYSPRYKRRPVVHVREEEAYAPPILEEGIDEERFGAVEEEVTSVTDLAGVEGYGPSGGAPRPGAPPMAKAMARRAPPPPSAPAPQPAAAPPPPMRQALRASTDVQTRVVEVGDLLEYAIENTVTVKRNQSALVPILLCPFEGERVAVFNAEVRERNPMSTIRFENTTGMTLEGGPLTVLEGESYVGESMLETLKPGEERLVPYSVELGCTVVTEKTGDLQPVHRTRIVNGSLVVERYRLERTTYLAKNKLERELDLIVEHRFKPGWDLVDTQEPEEKTESFYRFRVAVKPGTTAKLVVHEKGDAKESWSLHDADRDRVGLWLSQGYIDEKAKAALLELVALNETIGSLEYWIRERERDVQEIFTNQERLRQNLASLGATPEEQGLRDRYVETLGLEEDRLAEMAAEIQGWKKERTTKQQELRQGIASLKLDITW